MQKYFELLAKEAKKDTTKYGICELTIKIAKKAGYHRAPYTFKNGSVRVRTMYDKPFDSVLTAKWLMFYKSLFIGKLGKHPEFEDSRIDIINNTFFMVMNCLKLDKAVDDNVINRYTNSALAGRIQNELIERGSAKRLEEYKKGKGLNMRLKKVADYQALSLDKYIDDNNGECPNIYVTEDFLQETFLEELGQKLKDNPYGIRLLDCMLNSGRRIHMSRIDDYMDMLDEEKTEESRRQISDAYYIIKESLKDFISQKYKYDFSYNSDECVNFANGGIEED